MPVDVQGKLPEDSTHPIASPRIPVSKLPASLIEGSRLGKYIADLEQNQQIAHCCRHPENHDIVSYYSPVGFKKQEPDIYVFVCTCGKAHRRVCMGQGDTRPMWTVQ